MLAGLVLINGQKAVLGQRADPENDAIEVDGRVIQARREFLYYLLSKPVGVVTTNANMEGQKTVQDLLPPELKGKVFPVGRLDKDTSGLLLLTNDGVVAYRLTHPSFDHEKEYEVETFEPIPEGSLEKLRSGLKILGEKTKPAVVKRIGACKYSITLTEGRNRQIRRMSQKVGYPVKNLRRIRIESIVDDAIPVGRCRCLSAGEVAGLRERLGLEA